MKIVYLVQKLPDLSDEEFKRHWTTTHAELAVAIPGLREYSINLPSTEQRGQRPLDGYAVLRFDDWESAKAAWQTPQGRATAADGDLFMASAQPLIVEPRAVVDGRGVRL